LMLALPFVFCFLGLGLFISTRVATREAAGQMAMGTMMPSIFLSGYVIASRTTHPTLAHQGPIVLSGLAVASVAAEAWLSFALWFPRLRVAAIVVGVVMHAMVPLIFGLYVGLIVFSLTAVSLYPLFLNDGTSDLSSTGNAERIAG